MGFLKGKTAIITGGGRSVLKDGSCGSIGYGIATAYAKEGANLVITGRNKQKLADAKEELERLYNIEVLPVQADVSAGADNETVVRNVIDETIAKFGRIDVLINNAQASASGVTLADHTTEQFDLALYSGLYAAFYYMKACYPHLKETKGSVINTLHPVPDYLETMVNVLMLQRKKESVVLPELPQMNGVLTASMLISFVHSHGQHSLKISSRLILKPLKLMLKCLLQDIMEMLRKKSEEYAFS